MTGSRMWTSAGIGYMMRIFTPGRIVRSDSGNMKVQMLPDHSNCTDTDTDPSRKVPPALIA